MPMLTTRLSSAEKTAYYMLEVCPLSSFMTYLPLTALHIIENFSLPAVITYSSFVFDQWRLYRVCDLVWMAWTHLISTEWSPSLLTTLTDHMQREPSLQTLASLSPLTLLNCTSQTWSLWALRVAIQVYGIASFEQRWSTRSEYLSLRFIGALWNRH